MLFDIVQESATETVLATISAPSRKAAQSWVRRNIPEGARSGYTPVWVRQVSRVYVERRMNKLQDQLNELNKALEKET